MKASLTNARVSSVAGDAQKEFAPNQTAVRDVPIEEKGAQIFRKAFVAREDFAQIAKDVGKIICREHLRSLTTMQCKMVRASP